MKLLSIMPIARSVRVEALTYFCSDDLPLGTVVSVPLRGKIIAGIIVDSKDATESKAEIKNLNFPLKKISAHKSGARIPSWIMTSAKELALDAMTSVGSVLASIIPKIALENPEIFSGESASKENRFETLAIQSANNERFDAYRSIIRESFAKKMSVAVICPTEEDSERVFAVISKGIEKRSALFTHPKSKRALINWMKMDAPPLLFVGTSPMLSLLPQSIGTIIMEEESSRFYKERKSPYLDMRVVSRQMAKALGARMIFGDKLLSIETLAKIKEGKTHEYSRLSKRSFHKIQTLFVDMKVKQGEEKMVFRALSPDLEEMIKYASKSEKSIFIYVLRRGVSPQTVCRDCGETALCHKCEAPVVLHNRGGGKIFICHHCSAERSALEQCKRCGSWNLFSCGLGAEKILEEISRLTDREILLLNSDVAATPKEAKAIAKKFFSSRGIIVGTDMALRYIPEDSVDFAAIPSLDSLISLPDFRTSERVMHAVIDVKARARECMLVQGRSLNKVVEWGLSGDLDGFAENEIKARKEFGYPPYMRIVKLTVSGKREVARKEAALLVERLKDWHPTVFPAFIKTIKGETLLHIMIKVPRERWPEPKLSEILLSLPPSVRIDTSPSSLL